MIYIQLITYEENRGFTATRNEYYNRLTKYGIFFHLQSADNASSAIPFLIYNSIFLILSS